MARARGSYPRCRRFKSYSRYLHGILAQLGEHLPYKQRVTGSSPVGPIYAGVAELADAQDLKSCGTYTPVPVRFRSAALVKNGRNVEFTAFLLFFCFKMFEHL